MAGALGELDPGMARSLSEAGPEKLLENLAEEYAALFLVPGGIPPYESARVHGMLNQKPAWEAEEFYRRCGLVIGEECRILPDHLGMEMEFMGYLADKEACAQLDGDEEEALKWSGLQFEFFQDHIGRWAFGFLEDMAKYAFHPFYKGIGSLTMKFLEVEQEHLVVIRKIGEEDRLPGKNRNVSRPEGGKS
jgi:TorA maturation chaperone TorD